MSYLSIQCIQSQSAVEFLQLNKGPLLKNESLNNLIVGRTQSLIHKRYVGEQSLFFHLIHNEQAVTQVIMPDGDQALMILATMAHDPIVFEYLVGFIHNCFPNDPHP